jgi:hypothetical protein
MSGPICVATESLCPTVTGERPNMLDCDLYVRTCTPGPCEVFACLDCPLVTRTHRSLPQNQGPEWRVLLVCVSFLMFALADISRIRTIDRRRGSNLRESPCQSGCATSHLVHASDGLRTYVCDKSPGCHARLFAAGSIASTDCDRCARSVALTNGIGKLLSYEP